MIQLAPDITQSILAASAGRGSFYAEIQDIAPSGRKMSFGSSGGTDR
jgi:hypothetical protein